MPGTRGTYYKALLLLIVFSLNTVVSFACSFGGVFHDFHHKNSATTEHKHSHSSKHSHDSGHKHDHHKNSENKHDSNAPDDSKDNCCSGSIIKMQMVDKLISRSIEAPDLIFITSYVAAYSELFSLQKEEKTAFPKFVRWRPPATIQDLRIVIQSFQI